MKQRHSFWVILGVISAWNTQMFNVSAITADNPYQAIAGRNAFALRPPTPVNPAAPQPVQGPTKVLLQGINTILGHKQVLLKIQPPAPAKEQSVIMREGQREGEVEIQEIDPHKGLVKLRNSGQDLTLSMEKDAAKPVAGPVLMPAPALSAPALPAPAIRPAGLPAPPTPTTMPPAPSLGGSASKLPSRSLRTQTAQDSITALGSGNTALGGNVPSGANVAPPSLEEQTIMMEVHREANKAAVQAGTMPPLPPTDITHLLDQPAK